MIDQIPEEPKLCRRCSRLAPQPFCYCPRCGSASWGPTPPRVSTARGIGPEHLGQLGTAPWTIGDIGRGVGIFLLQAISVSVMLVLVLQLVEGGGRGIYALLLTFIVEATLLFAVWLFAVAKYRISWTALGLWRRPALRDGVLAVAALLAEIAAQVGYVSLLKAVGVDTQGVAPSTFIEEGGVVLVLLAVLALLVAPVAEEIFFRSFIFGGLVTRFGFWRAALASSALFSIAHVEPLKFLPLFVLGFVLAWVYFRSGALWASMFTHFLNNAITVIVILV